MKPTLKGQDCFDHDPVESWRPEDPSIVDYQLCLHIGPEEEIGADLFYVNVLSEQAAQQMSDKLLSRTKTIIVEPYSWPAVLTAIDQVLQMSDGVDWQAICEKLKTKFDWEFDNYRP